MTTETTTKSKNKLRTYRTFKLDHKQELYLTKIKDTHQIFCCKNETLKSPPHD